MASTGGVPQPRPSNVGIIAIDIYFPNQFVDQEDLEKHDGVDSGKYTIGLGQRRIAIVTDREDTHSICMSVVNNLMDKTGIAWKDIGHLEVGTETLIDKSKSVKSVLLQLWDKYDPGGDRDMEGCDTVNACYGGTSALFNAVDWVHSPDWDGRYAMVVIADIAVYAPGNCRPTSGAGAVAIIVGPDAALVMEPGTRSTHAENAYDFYKPNLHSAYPVVDSALSVECYLKAVDKCYALFCSKSNKGYPTKDGCSLSSIDHVLFHCPYIKLTHKAFARMAFADFLRSGAKGVPELEPFKQVELDGSHGNKELMKAASTSSASQYQAKTEASTRIAADTGNMYTASLYACLCSLLIHSDPTDLAGKRIGMFSYGSGFIASMFALRGTTDVGALQKLANMLEDVPKRLESRIRRSPEYFNDALDYLEKVAHLALFKPEHPPADLFPGSWYLVEVDEKHRRRYERVE